MAELESVLEKRLIDQLCKDESQWTYRPDIKTEEDLWANFKYILEQNNKAKLNDIPLSDSEFAKIKNDVSHASFYDAAKWLVGESGKVYVHVQRGNEQQRLRPVMELPLIARSLAAGVGDPTEFEENTEPFYLYRPDGGEEQGAGGPYAKRNAAERADCVFRVNGESMEPVYPDGCYVLVEKCSELKAGEIGAFSAGNELYIKEYQKDGLHSLNPRFETLTFADAACCVIGRVVGKAGELPSKEEIALYKAVEGER